MVVTKVRPKVEMVVTEVIKPQASAKAIVLGRLRAVVPEVKRGTAARRAGGNGSVRKDACVKLRIDPI